MKYALTCLVLLLCASTASARGRHRAQTVVPQTVAPATVAPATPAPTPEKLTVAPIDAVSVQPEDEELLQIEANVVTYTNAERARYGLPPLEVDHKLMATARQHSIWMVLQRIFQHSRIRVAENIAMGQPSSQDVVRSWMNSSGHRANILNPNHRHIGVAAFRTESGTIYWVQQFTQ